MCISLLIVCKVTSKGLLRSKLSDSGSVETVVRELSSNLALVSRLLICAVLTKSISLLIHCYGRQWAANCCLLVRVHADVEWQGKQSIFLFVLC